MMTSSDYKRLQFFQNECRTIAQKYLKKRQVVKCLIIFITIPCLFLANKYAWALILLSCLLEMLMLYYEKKGMDYHKKNREATQIMVLENSFCNEVKVQDYEHLLNDRAIMSKFDESKINRTYYNVLENKGARRFALNVAESVLYTKHLFKKYEHQKKKEIIFLLIASLLLIIVSFITITGENRFLIITPICALLSFLIVGELDSYLDLSDVLQGLEKIDGDISHSIETNDFNRLNLFRIYSDYHILTRETVPVPTKLYLKIRDDIHDIWKGRYQNYQEKFTEHATCDKNSILSTNFDNVLDPIYTERSKYISMVLRTILEKDYGNCISVKIEPVNSYSRSLIFKQTYAWSSTESTTVFTKFFISNNELMYTLHVLEEIYKIDKEHYSDWIDDELLRQENVLAYYHVNSFMNDTNKLESLDSVLSSEKWEQKKIKYQKQIQSALRTNFEVLNNEKISIAYIQEKVNAGLYNRKPGTFVIDLSWINDLDSAGVIHYDSNIPTSIYKGTTIPDAKHMGLINVELLNWSDTQKVVGIFDYKNVRYIVLLPRKIIFAPNNYVAINFPKLPLFNIYYTLEQYLDRNHNILMLEPLHQDFDYLCSRLINAGNFRICHNDFHACNIFVSDNSFKIIDIENVGYSYPYADLCRLQISLLIYHCMYTHDYNTVSDFFRCIVSNDAASQNELVKFLIELKNDFSNSSFQGFDYTDYLSALALEVLLQIYYSICSNRRVTQVWVDGYRNVINKIKIR